MDAVKEAGDGITLEAGQKEMAQERGDAITGVSDPDQKNYEALLFIAQGKPISIRKICEVTGLQIRRVSSLHKQYLCAKLLGAGVDKIASTVLESYTTCCLAIEYHFSLRVIRDFLDKNNLNAMRVYMFLAGNFCKFANIRYDEIAELGEQAIRSKIEAISRKYKLRG